MQAESGQILVVDDDEMNRDMLSRRLQRKGYAVSLAKNGSEALELVRQRTFDLVLLDIMMPGIDGLQVLERIRDTCSVAELPVIMATAKGASDDVVRALDLGANDYVTKPLDFPVVLARLRTQLSLKRAKQELASAHARMKNDLEAAARVQQALMPKSLPKTAGVRCAWRFVPCDELAGDILDVFELDELRVGSYLLDVSGHGVPSALLSVTVSRLLSHMPEGSLLFGGNGAAGGPRLLSPAEVASQLNTRFPMDADTRQYFTLVYGILDLERLEFRYVSAAHPGPVHLRRGKESTLHPANGLAIGWFPNAEYEESLIALEPGDRLYLYSDGIVEAEDPQERHFGSARLLETLEVTMDLPLDSSVERLLEELRLWCGRSGPGDDVSILALEIPGA